MLYRFRFVVYLVCAVALLVPAIWGWPMAYRWDHGSPCVTATVAAKTAAALHQSTSFAKPTPPDACVDLRTMVARRKTADNERRTPQLLFPETPTPIP